ncbi:MAG: TonB family protein, partial [Fulvivirga sp.]|uniref:energy transducer TonB n=1 Tax=Fulvivirga sp. TaxID=1931237 RepID=UPI0032ECC973
PTNEIDKSILPLDTAKEVSKDENVIKEKMSESPIQKLEEQSTPNKEEVLQKKVHIASENEIAESIQKEEVVKPAPTEVLDTEYIYENAKPLNGTSELYRYFEESLQYPEAAMADSIQGEVNIIFTITKKGEVRNVVVDKSLGELFDQEAIRLIENMPPWVPAMVNGDSVDSRVSVPIYFRIKNE